MLVWPHTPGSPSSSSASSKRGCGVLGGGVAEVGLLTSSPVNKLESAAAHCRSAPSWGARRPPEKEAVSLCATALLHEPCKGLAKCGVAKVPVWMLAMSGEQLSLVHNETKYRENRIMQRGRRSAPHTCLIFERGISLSTYYRQVGWYYYLPFWRNNYRYVRFLMMIYFFPIFFFFFLHKPKSLFCPYLGAICTHRLH